MPRIKIIHQGYRGFSRLPFILQKMLVGMGIIYEKVGTTPQKVPNL